MTRLAPSGRSIVIGLTAGFAVVAGLAIGAGLGVAIAAEPPIQLAERWAASPLIVQSRITAEPAAVAVETLARADGPTGPQAVLVATIITLLLGITLLESLVLALVQTVAGERRHHVAAAAAPLSRAPTEVDYQARCKHLFATITQLWRRAETAVFDLDEGLPLRALLFKEMNQISQRLAMDPSQRIATPGAMTTRHDEPYWRALSQRLNQSSRDLSRIGAVAEAAGAGFGGRSNEPRIPKTRDEACFILGANREADPETLQRLVRALRQCWHPDLAQTDSDRRHREARLKQINAAHDLITGKRSEG